MNEIASMLDENDRVDFQEFDGITITKYDFTKVEFESIEFKNCRFIDCIFDKCYFSKCTFIECDMSNCRYHNAYFKDCKMNGSKGIGADFQESIIKNTTIDTCIFRYANFTMNKWDNVIVKDSDFMESSINNTKFIKTKLQDTNLTSVDLFKSNMKNMDLSTCQIDGIIISEGFLELKGAKINMYQAARLVAILGINVVE